MLASQAAEAMDDYRSLDGEAERVLRRERECLARVDDRGSGDATDSVGHGLLKRVWRASALLVYKLKWKGRIMVIRQPFEEAV